jgi:hypothetical protein
MTINITSDLHVFIISWEGQHENALNIASQLNDISDKVSIVYSDPDDSFTFKADPRAVKRPNNLYWGDKFKTCLDLCNHDNLLIIHGDCISNHWGNVVEGYDKAIRNFNNLGVWSPIVDYTLFDLKKTSIARFIDTNYEIVCYIDGIVFGISKAIQNRMKRASYEQNKFGWAIDRMIACSALVNNELLIIDKSLKIEHPNKRGYDEKIAYEQENLFIRQLNLSEIIQNRLIHSYIELNALQKNI